MKEHTIKQWLNKEKHNKNAHNENMFSLLMSLIWEHVPKCAH